VRLRLAGLVVAVCLLSPGMLRAQRISLSVPLDSLVAVAQRDSLDPSAQYDVGVGYWFYHRYAAADSAFRRAIAIEPKYARGYLALAWLQYVRRPKLGKMEAKHQLPDSLKPVVAEAERFYEQAFLIDPLVDLQVLGLVFGPELFTMLPGSADNYLVALIDGAESFWAGQYDGAYALLDRAVAKVAPADRAKKLPSVLLWYHGLAAAHVDHNDAAAEDFRILLQRELDAEKTDSLRRFSDLPSNEIRYVLATLEGRAGHFDDATRLFQEALTNNLGLYMAHVQLALMQERRGRTADAIVERQRALETQPDDPGLLYDLGVTLASARRLQEARDVLTRAMAANPRNARIPYALGQVQLLLGDRAAAKVTLSRFVDVAPSMFGRQIIQVRQQLAEMN
jgi:tetratricopeptide (TPR) repeat protein